MEKIFFHIQFRNWKKIQFSEFIIGVRLGWLAWSCYPCCEMLGGVSSLYDNMMQGCCAKIQTTVTQMFSKRC